MTTIKKASLEIKCKCANHFIQRKANLKFEWAVSQTVPNDTMSLRTIIGKYANGVPISNGRLPIYDEDNESVGINVKTLDLVDIQNLKAQNLLRMTEIQTALAKETEEKRQLYQAEKDAEFEKNIREKINAEKAAAEKH